MNSIVAKLNLNLEGRTVILFLRFIYLLEKGTEVGYRDLASIGSHINAFKCWGWVRQVLLLCPQCVWKIYEYLSHHSMPLRCIGRNLDWKGELFKTWMKHKYMKQGQPNWWLNPLPTTSPLYTVSFILNTVVKIQAQCSTLVPCLKTQFKNRFGINTYCGN